MKDKAFLTEVLLTFPLHTQQLLINTIINTALNDLSLSLSLSPDELKSNPLW